MSWPNRPLSRQNCKEEEEEQEEEKNRRRRRRSNRKRKERHESYQSIDGRLLVVPTIYHLLSKLMWASQGQIVPPGFEFCNGRGEKKSTPQPSHSQCTFQPSHSQCTSPPQCRTSFKTVIPMTNHGMIILDFLQCPLPDVLTCPRCQ